MKRKNMFEFVLTALFGSIILVLSLIPSIGYIMIFPGVSVTIIHIPVLIGAAFLKLKNTVVLGLFFGIGSLLVALMYASQPFDLAFRNPLISILPRILFAVAAFYIFKLFNYIFSRKNGNIILVTLLSIITVFAVFLGSRSISNKIIYNKYNTEYQVLQGMTDPDIIEQQTIIVNELRVIADAKNASTNKILNPILIVISIGIVGLYIYLIIYKKSKNVNIPSSMIVATLIHTVLVLFTVWIIKPSDFYSTFNNDFILKTIFLLAALNGTIEALMAAIIGTPIAVAVKNRLEIE